MEFRLEDATAATFEPHVGTSFRIEGVPPLTLAAIHPGGPAPAELRPPFALEFTAEHDGYLPQAIYRLEHDALGALDLFLVPMGLAGNGLMRYESVFG